MVLSVVIRPQLLVLLFLLLVVVESISLGDGLTVGDVLQFVVQLYILVQMPHGFIPLPSEDADIGKHPVDIAPAHRIAVFHHLLSIIAGRVELSRVIVDPAEQGIQPLLLAGRQPVS